MNKEYKRLWPRGVLVVVFAGLLLGMGCFLFPSSGWHNALVVEGRILSSIDSTFVEGAYVAVFNNLMQRTYDYASSDKVGEFKCSWSIYTEEGIGDSREWVVRVLDVDGDENGVFADLDTVIVEENPGQNGSTEWYLDLYVVME